MKSFEETIKGAMVGSDTKKVVRAASEGDLDKYKDALTSYSWPHTRDYSMVLLILSPIVAVIKAAEKRGDTESTDPRIAELERRVNAILGKQKFKDLCTAIGAGNGGIIWSTLDSFKNYRELLKLLSNDSYGTGGPSDKFMIRAKKITSWMSANKTFINTKLIPFVRDTLGIRFSTAFGQGLRHTPSAPVASGSAAAAAAAAATTTTTTTTEPEPMPVKRLTEEETVNEELKRQWQENRHNRETRAKIGFDEMVTKANEEHERLKEMGIFSEGDNTRNSRSGGSFSTNFIKLFIRYIQRSFSKLNGYVKIYYYPNMYEEFFDISLVWCKEMTESERDAANNAIQEREEKRKNQYWSQVKKLVSESEKEGTICLIFNQVVKKDEPQRGGHANLTVICGGNYKIFETVQDCKNNTMGNKDYNGNDIKVILGSIQSDKQNCVSIVFGYIESLMKQMSAWIEEKNYKSDKKQFSKYVWNQINGYSKVKISDDIQGTDRRSLQALLPPKYIRYIQTSQGRNKLINLPNTEEFRKLPETDQQKIREVAEELRKVVAKHDLSQKPLAPFLNDVAKDDTHLNKVLKPGVTKLAKAIGKKPSTITWGDLKDLMSKKRLSSKYDNGNYIVWQKPTGEKISVQAWDYTKPLIDFFDEEKYSTEKASVKEELETNPIYKVVCDEPLKMSIGELRNAEDKFFDYMRDIIRMNDPAQMRRRRNLLKVATLVDVLDKRREGSETMQDKVRDEIGKVEELLPSP